MSFTRLNSFTRRENGSAIQRRRRRRKAAPPRRGRRQFYQQGEWVKAAPPRRWRKAAQPQGGESTTTQKARGGSNSTTQKGRFLAVLPQKEKEYHRKGGKENSTTRKGRGRKAGPPCQVTSRSVSSHFISSHLSFPFHFFHGHCVLLCIMLLPLASDTSDGTADLHPRGQWSD